MEKDKSLKKYMQRKRKTQLIEHKVQTIKDEHLDLIITYLDIIRESQMYDLNERA